MAVLPMPGSRSRALPGCWQTREMARCWKGRGSYCMLFSGGEPLVYSSLKLQVKCLLELGHRPDHVDLVPQVQVLLVDDLLPGRRPAVLGLEFDEPAPLCRQEEDPVGLADDAPLELRRADPALLGVQACRPLQARFAHRGFSTLTPSSLASRLSRKNAQDSAVPPRLRKFCSG